MRRDSVLNYAAYYPLLVTPLLPAYLQKSSDNVPLHAQGYIMNYAAYYVPPLLVSSYYLLASILLISLGGLIIIASFCGCIGGCAVSGVIFKSYMFLKGTARQDFLLHVFFMNHLPFL
jgi:hypothetical protein